MTPPGLQEETEKLYVNIVATFLKQTQCPHHKSGQSPAKLIVILCRTEPGQGYKKRMISSSVCRSIIGGLTLSNFIIFAQLETNKDFMRKFNVQLSPYDIML